MSAGSVPLYNVQSVTSLSRHVTYLYIVAVFRQPDHQLQTDRTVGGQSSDHSRVENGILHSYINVAVLLFKIHPDE